MKKKYLFALDSYCFIWKNRDNILLYNSLSGQGYVYDNVTVLSSFVDQLIQKENLYSVWLDSSILSDKAVSDFICSARENFCGDLLAEENLTGKPIVVIPEININEDVDRNLDNINSSAVFGSTILKNLTDLYLELGGQCQYDCKECSSTYKQIEWCHNTGSVMPIEVVEKIFAEVKFANVFDIYFTGGNVLEYPFWNKLTSLISSYTKNSRVNMTFCVNARNLQEKKYEDRIKELLEIKNIYLKIYIDPVDLSSELHNSILEIKDKTEFICKIIDEENIQLTTNFFDETSVNVKHLPYYTGTNLSFFEKYIFINKEDILCSHLSKKDIFSHQLVNANYFGKLLVKSDGEIYADVTGNPIGSYKEGIKKIVYKELRGGTFWRKTRDQVEPCKKCLYKLLCPPPSNYETAIGRQNLCHVKL